MRGHVHKRGRTWTYVMDAGRDPATGHRRQRTKGGFRTRRDAEDALAVAVSSVNDGTYIAKDPQTVGEWALLLRAHCRRSSTTRTNGSATRRNGPRLPLMRWCASARRSRCSSARPGRLGDRRREDRSRGQRVGLLYGSASYDEEVFDQPNRFDIFRYPNLHVGFGGGGVHFCPGSRAPRAIDGSAILRWMARR